jgi:transmembrane sensor
VSDPLRELGSFVAEQQDRSLEQRAIVNEVVRRTIAERTRRRLPRRALMVLAPLAAALGVLLYLLLRPVNPPPALSTSQPTVLLAGSEDQAHAFPDGTTVLLAAGGEAQVTDVSADGGRVVLRNGRMLISVPPNRGSRWAFAAGNYLVEVKGTRFDLSWHDGSQTFDLEMFDGSVRVSGAGIEPRLVVAGQRLTLGGEKHATATASPSSPSVPRADETDEPHKQPSATPASGGASNGASTRGTPAERPSWQPLALEGKYSEAVRLAEEAGFDGVVARSSASELLLLGDACRFAGKTARAGEAYQSVRTRHAGTLEAKRAIFSLGVLAFPGKAAVPLFEQYLSEAPGGPLAPEALGRILEVRHRSGERDAAKKLATQYLAQHPKGAHARLAQSILDDAAP